MPKHGFIIFYIQFNSIRYLHIHTILFDQERKCNITYSFDLYLVFLSKYNLFQMEEVYHH